MATRIGKGFKVKGGKIVPTIKHLDASAQARARGKPPKNPRRWKVRRGPRV